MAASFSPNKDYDLFFRVARIVTEQRQDVTFIGIGGYDKADIYQRLVRLSETHPRIIFHARSDEVEALMNVATLGLLFSTNGEGVSNSLLEFMCLAKPVIATDAGGNSEVIRHNINGYLVTDQSDAEIAQIVVDLLDDPAKCKAFGESGRSITEALFSLDRMGKSFEKVYCEMLN
jgi:glycosyltransferase involved in cell wall biosynthesis